MTPDDPRHGTYAGAQEHARTGSRECERCARARRKYQRGLELDHIHNRRRLRPAGPARRHIARLVDAGHTIAEIAVAAGVAERTVRHIATTGTTAKVDTIAAIIAVPLTPAPGRYVSRFRVVRRVEALNALGWPRDQIAARIGMRPTSLSTTVTGKRGARPDHGRVTIEMFNAIDAVFRELCMTPGPSNWARTRAARLGYAPPLAWDDIDDPNETPAPGRHRPASRATDLDVVHVDRLLGGEWSLAKGSPRSVRFEVIGRWVDAGHPTNELERLTGWNVSRDLRAMRAADAATNDDEEAAA